MLETIIIYGLYLALPSILLYRSLGPKKTGLIFTGIIALHQTASTNIDQITLPIVTESDTKDIEFVKQSIGHQKLDTTSAYVNKLSNQEKQERISRLE